MIEFVSGKGDEERDITSPFSAGNVKAGKFWVYEQAIRVPFYAIYEADNASVEVYELTANHYQRCIPNERGYFPLDAMGVELGIWNGEYLNQRLPWLRWWDSKGHLLLNGDERAEQEKQRAEQEKQRAEQEKQRAEQEKQRAEQEKQQAERLAEKLRKLGVDTTDLI